MVGVCRIWLTGPLRQQASHHRGGSQTARHHSAAQARRGRTASAGLLLGQSGSLLDRARLAPCLSRLVAHTLAVEIVQLAAEHDIEPKLEANHSGSCTEAAQPGGWAV